MDKLDQKTKVIIMIGALFSIMLAALDQSIVATAIPKIIKDFGDIDKMSWIFSSYLLASTTVIPVAGKLSDIYGRKFFIISGIIIFLLGSILCGISDSMTQLIIFRVIQGIGAGIMMVNASATIGDIFPPTERGKWQGITGVIFGIVSILGPLLGGILSDYYSWRFCFYINIPLGLIAIYILSIYFKNIKSKIQKQIDYLGALLISLFIISFILIFEINGNKLSINTTDILLIISSIILLTLFIFTEKKATNPVIPLDLFKNMNFSLTVSLLAITSIGINGIMIYTPLLAQKVIGMSASGSGMVLTPMLIALSIATIINGQIMSRTGKYKIAGILGVSFTLLGTVLLSNITPGITFRELTYFIIPVGIGIGLTLPVFNVSLQNLFDHSKIGIVSASAQLSRNIGGVIWVSILGIIMNHNLNVLSDSGSLQYTENMFLQAIKNNFIFMSGVMAISLILVFFIREIPLRKHHAKMQEFGQEIELNLAQLDDINEPQVIKKISRK